MKYLNNLNVQKMNMSGMLFIYFLFGFSGYLMVAAGASSIALLIALIYLAGFCHLYAYRQKNFGFFLLLSVSYAILFGVPSITVLIQGTIKNDVQKEFVVGLLLIGIILIFLSYREARNKNQFYIPLDFRPNKAFVFILAAISLAQAFKLIAYLKVLSSSEYGHLAIWVDGDALISSVPSWIRLISGGTLIAGILGVALFRDRWLLQLFCILLLASDMVIGIRNKGFFGILAAVYILSLFDREQAARIFKKISSPLILVGAFIVFSAISYLREGYQMDMMEYGLIVLDSLASIVDGLLDQVANSNCMKTIDSSLVVTQVWTLLGLGNIPQISGEFNFCITGDPHPLTSVSSSVIFESLLLVGHFWLLLIICYFLLIYGLMRFLERKRSILNLSILCSLAPAFLYSLRAELFQPIVFLMKSLPYLIIAFLLLDKRSTKN